MSAHILLVDDDDLMRRSLAFTLTQADYKTTTAASAEDALLLVKRESPDLVLLDIGLPGMDGLQALPHFQKHKIPIIFLTARRRELDEILGLELGAEDYVTKPFDADILLARIRVVLRRHQNQHELQTQTETLTLGDLTINPRAHTISIKEKNIKLSAREFTLLHTLALDIGNVVAVDQLLAQVWGAEFIGEPQVVYVHIRWLREKLEENASKPERIITVRGIGYKLIEKAL